MRLRASQVCWPVILKVVNWPKHSPLFTSKGRLQDMFKLGAATKHVPIYCHRGFDNRVLLVFESRESVRDARN